MKHEVDTALIVQALRDRGHRVERVIATPDNAGEYEFIVDGATLTLEETRKLLELDAERKLNASREAKAKGPGATPAS